MPFGILIVDDSAAIRGVLRDALQRQKGWQVCGEAENGQDGIEKAELLIPDLIVLDLAMPVMNGLEAARTLSKSLPTVPLVLFTSYETTNLRDEALKSGFKAVVPKSDLSLLIRSLREILTPVP
jgi:DNA-binding NarL/FixJ family response regulator